MHGGAVNAWDAPLNQNFDQIDQNLGGSYNLTISSTTVAATYNSSFATLPSTASTITLPSTVAYNLYYSYTGTMTNAQDLAFPAVGGIYIVTNGSSGSFALTAVVAGSTTVNVALGQGGSNTLVTDGANVINADSNALARIETYLGNPNGNVSGTAGAANGSGTDAIWDGTNFNLYATITSGSTATAVWAAASGKPTAQGYLTLGTAASPIITVDTTSAVVSYVPFDGDWTLMSNGTAIFPYKFTSSSVTLTAVNAANIIYDVFAYFNAGTPVIGTGVAWSVSTAGSGSRGSGAGTTELARLGGVYVNAVQITLSNNGVATVCPAQQGVYLGSVWIDSVAGQVTCHRSWGQSRKFGVWSFSNRMPIILKGGDSTAAWNYNSTVVRPANGNTANSISVFEGLAEEIVDVNLMQIVEPADGGSTATCITGIGYNSTTVASGLVGRETVSGFTNWVTGIHSKYTVLPAIGINTMTALESVGTPAGPTNQLFIGTEANMLMTVQYRG